MYVQPLDVVLGEAWLPLAGCYALANQRRTQAVPATCTRMLLFCVAMIITSDEITQPVRTDNFGYAGRTVAMTSYKTLHLTREVEVICCG
jgi:hypothetical protein